MNEIERLLTFTKEAVSPFHTVEAAGKLLEEKGFSPLSWKEEWSLNPGGKYYLVHHGSALFAFTIGKTQRRSRRYGWRQPMVIFRDFGSNRIRI